MAPLARTFVTVRCIVQNIQDQILLIRRSELETSMVGAWELPGGHIDFGEDPNLAVVRELREETGILIKPPVLFGIFSRVNKYREHSICITYLADVKSPPVKISFEHSEYVWLRPHEALRLALTKRSSSIIRSFLRDINASQ